MNIPDCIGLTETEAMRRLQEAGCTVQTSLYQGFRPLQDADGDCVVRQRVLDPDQRTVELLLSGFKRNVSNR
mgnify:CR=1 FL=1